MATLQQKQEVIDCLRARVITIQLSRHDHDEYQEALKQWEGDRTNTQAQHLMEKAYYDLKDDYAHQLQQHGYDEIDDWGEWQNAFEYAYLDGARQAPVFSTHTGEAIKLMFEWV